MIVLFGILFEVIFWVVFVTIAVRTVKVIKKRRGSSNQSSSNNTQNNNTPQCLNEDLHTDSFHTYCDYCGASVDRGTKKCPSCGARINK